MTVQSQMGQDKQGDALTLNIVFREIVEPQESCLYWVAECLEIPGCVSQGDTREEAERNIQEAMRLCLSVLFEDCLKTVAANHSMPNLVGISSQKRLSVDPTPQLDYAVA